MNRLIPRAMAEIALKLACLCILTNFSACSGNDGSPTGKKQESRTWDEEQHGGMLTDAEPSSSIDLAQGGRFEHSSGAVIEALPGTAPQGLPAVTFQVSVSGQAGQDSPEWGPVVTRTFDITAENLDAASLKAPLVVHIPIEPGYEPDDPDPNAYVIETRQDSGQPWTTIDAWPVRVRETNRIRFVVEHFSQYRARYIGTTWTGNLERWEYETDRFTIVYYQPREFGQKSRYIPPADADWAGKVKSEGAVPDYVEDVGAALENALTGILGIKDSSGTPLFTAPDGKITCELTFVGSASSPKSSGDAGEFSFLSTSYTFKLSTRLESPDDILTVAIHEMFHMFCDQHYTIAGAVLNRWFFEAAADSTAAALAGLDSTAKAFYYKREMSPEYLSVPLDSSANGSMYAAAHFVDYVISMTVPTLVADTIRKDSTSDLEAMDAVTREKSSRTLEDLYTAYVIDPKGGRSFQGSLWSRTILKESSIRFAKTVPARDWTAAAIEIRTAVDKPSLLAVRVKPGSSDLRLTLLSMKALGGVPATVASVVPEPGKWTGFSIPAFRKTAAAPDESMVAELLLATVPGDADSWFEQNHEIESWLLESPVVSVSGAKITWTMPVYPDGVLSGFNAYVGGRKSNTASMIDAASREWILSEPAAADQVVVTAVDVEGNEWPEPPEDIREKLKSAKEIHAGMMINQLFVCTRDGETVDDPATPGFIGSFSHAEDSIQMLLSPDADDCIMPYCYDNDVQATTEWTETEEGILFEYEAQMTYNTHSRIEGFINNDISLRYVQVDMETVHSYGTGHTRTGLWSFRLENLPVVEIPDDRFNGVIIRWGYMGPDFMEIPETEWTAQCAEIPSHVLSVSGGWSEDDPEHEEGCSFVRTDYSVCGPIAVVVRGEAI